MSFSRPDLATLVDRTAGDIESRLPGTDARLRRTVLNVLAVMHAGAVHGLYGYLDWLALQLMPDTAELEHLERWCAIWGVSRTAATMAAGSVIFTGNDAAVIPAGTVLQRSDGAEYTVDGEVIISSGSATADVTAVTGGADGNTVSGSALTLVSPITGVDSSATLDTDITGGDDPETDSNLRLRLLARIQQPPHGGADFDYEMWSLEVAGVTRVWVFPEYLGLGTVGVSFVCDGQAVTIIPDAATVTEVQDYIDERRPVTADVTVFAPTPVDLDFTIELTPSTSTVQAAVEAELEDLLVREAEPGGTILLSHIREAISLAAGETDHILTVPVADVTHGTGEIAIMGAITWL